MGSGLKIVIPACTRSSIALVALGGCAAAAAPAHGGYAGRNGAIATVYDQFDRGGGFLVSLRLLDSRGATKARFSRCFREDESEDADRPCPYDPAFTPDGRTIAHTLGRRLALRLVFTGTVSKQSNLYSVNLDGSDLTRLTKAGGGSPA